MVKKGCDVTDTFHWMPFWMFRWSVFAQRFKITNIKKKLRSNLATVVFAVWKVELSKWKAIKKREALKNGKSCNALPFWINWPTSPLPYRILELPQKYLTKKAICSSFQMVLRIILKSWDWVEYFALFLTQKFPFFWEGGLLQEERQTFSCKQVF